MTFTKGNAATEAMLIKTTAPTIQQTNNSKWHEVEENNTYLHLCCCIFHLPFTSSFMLAPCNSPTLWVNAERMQAEEEEKKHYNIISVDCKIFPRCTMKLLSTFYYLNECSLEMHTKSIAIHKNKELFIRMMITWNYARITIDCAYINSVLKFLIYPLTRNLYLVSLFQWFSWQNSYDTISI